MNRLVSASLALALLTAPAYAAQTYQIDPNHTNIVWKADHMGFSRVSGKFADVSGTITLDDAKPENSSVSITVKPASIVTGIPKFDAHLKNADFLDVEKFPEARFVSTKVEPTGKNSAKLSGDLTLHGVTKPITFEVTLNKRDFNPMYKKDLVGFSVKGAFKRSDFGMNYGLPNVGDEVLLDIEAEGQKEP